MKKILITGGAGFIGKRLAEKILENGHEIRVLDTSSTHENFFRDKKILNGAQKIQGSILDSNCLINSVRGCDIVIHLAARLGVKRTDMDGLACMNINVNGTTNVLESCVKENVEKIIFSSSSEVYGNANKSAISESSPLNPISVYGVSKIAGEEYIKAYTKSYGFKFTIFRFFNVYGLGQVAEFVIPRFAKNVLEKKPPIIYGDGKQVRSFCYVDDVVDGIISTLHDDRSDNQIFNIGNQNEPISIKDLANKMLKLAGLKHEPEFISMRDSDRSLEREVSLRIPDISKIKKTLRYEPKVGIDAGIKKVLEYGNIVDSWYDPL